MARPIPVWPRGPRRLRRRSQQLLLGCSRLSPEWELAMVDVLMRPKIHTRGRVQHRDGEQAWSCEIEERARAVIAEAGSRLGVIWDVTFPPAGEYYLVDEVRQGFEVQARGLAVALSRSIADNWFVFGRLLVKGGRFYRRRFGYRMEVVPATDVHLPRGMRAKLKGLI